MKKILIFLCIIAGLFAIGIAVILNSSLQTKIANSLVPELSVDKVSIGFSNAKLTGVKYAKLANIDEIEASYSLFDAISGKINVQSLTIKNAKIDTKAIPSNAEKTEQKPTQTSVATKNEFKFPYQIQLDNLKANFVIDGKDFSISAKAISAKEDLKFESGFIEATTDGATLKTSITGEKNSAQIKAILEADKKKVVQLSAELPYSYKDISAQLRIDATDNLVQKFLPNTIALPTFSTALYADVKASIDLQNVSINFVGDSKISALEKLSPSLKPIGECAVDVKINAKKTGEKIEVSSFDANLSESGTPIVNISAKPFVANNSRELENAELAITMSIPTRIVEAFAPDFKITSDNICTKMSARKRNEMFEIFTTSPISLTNATISKAGEPLVKNINILTNVNAQVGKATNAKISIDVVDSQTSKLTIESQINYAENIADIKFIGKGNLNPIISRVHSLSSIESLGLGINLNSELKYASNSILVKELKASITDKDGKNATNITLDSPITYNLSDAKIITTSNKILSINAPSFPFALIKPFVPELDAEKTALSISVSSENQKDFSADISASAYSMSYKKDGKYLVQNLTISANAKAQYNTEKVSVDLTKIILGTGTNSFCTGNATAEYNLVNKSIISAQANIATSLPQIFNQPALLKFSNISRGSADISATFDGKNAQANIAINSLLTRTSSDVIDTLKAEVKSDLKSLFANLDIKSTRGESNATINFDNVEKLDLKLTSKSLVLEDIMTLVGAFSNPTYIDQESLKSEKGKSQRIVKPTLDVLQKEDSIAKKDTKAFWDIGKNITLEAQIKKLTSKNSTMLEDFSTKLSSTSTELNLQHISGNVLSAKLDGSAKITFDSARNIPYKFDTSSFSLKGLDASQIFADKENPMLSGIFDATLKVEGAGNNTDHLLKYLCGEALINSQSAGILRLLDKNSIAGRSTSIVGGVFKLTGRLLNNKVKELDGIGELISLFSKTDFQTAQIKLSRNSPDYNYNIDNVEIKTNSLILSSKSGKIFFDPNAQSFGDQKMNIPVVIYAKGSTKTLLEQIGYAKTKTENSEFYEGPTFYIQGTVSKPSNNLIDVLTSTKRVIGNALDKLNFFKKQ